MRKRNSVWQLNRKPAHRKAMLRNMATSLLEHERIESTRAKIKALQPYVEKIITRAKKSADESLPIESKVHQKRELLKKVRERTTLVKLCDDIAHRYKERQGGYTRILRIANRASDNSEMAILELVERKEKILIQEERRERNLGALPKKQREKMKEKLSLKIETKPEPSKKDKAKEKAKAKKEKKEKAKKEKLEQKERKFLRKKKDDNMK